MKIGIIGPGKVGCALATALDIKGHVITGLTYLPEHKGLISDSSLLANNKYCSDYYKSVEDADIIFITVPDRIIGEAAAYISESIDSDKFKGKVFFHCSGALTSEVLRPIQRKGAGTASLHPIQTFADRENGWRALEGIYFGFEGSDTAKEIALALVQCLNGRMLEIKAGDKQLYHAAACIISNFMVALSYMAGQILHGIGVDAETAVKSLSPLLGKTVDNILANGSLAALTGPISRGDCNVVEGHINALEERYPQILEAYRSMGIITAEVALKKGSIDKEKADMLKQLLSPLNNP